MKKLLLTTMIAASFSSVAFAETTSTQDMDLLFQEVPVTAQLEPLSTQEMKSTEGAWVPIVMAAAAGGLYNGISYYSGTKNRTFSGWSTAIGTGIVGGGISGIAWWSAPVWGGGIALTGGYVAGRLR